MKTLVDYEKVIDTLLDEAVLKKILRPEAAMVCNIARTRLQQANSQASYNVRRAKVKTMKPVPYFDAEPRTRKTA